MKVSENIAKIIGGGLLVLLGILSKGAKQVVSHSTVGVEKIVNKATRLTEETVSRNVVKALESPNITRGVAIGGSRIYKSTHSNAQTTHTSIQPRLVNCPQCYGRGNVRCNDRYVYNCRRCNGRGKIFIK